MDDETYAPAPKRRLNPQKLRDHCAIIGFGVFLLGLESYDWRIAAVVGGLTLMVVPIIGTLKGTR